jgi:zeaxanthin glucosyltransferase
MLADIWQSPAGSEFPGRQLKPWCHQLGPLVAPAARQPVDFPYERLDGRPLVYASLGTIQNRLFQVFGTIIDACEGQGCQLVVSLGNTASAMKQQLPSWPIVVNVAPQLELLERAALTITHAGLNTTLESLVNGIPLVAIPIANDQPAVASRIQFAGIGRVVSFRSLNVAKLRVAVSEVLTQDDYRARAIKLGRQVSEAGGVHKAAEIVEQAIASKMPVCR